MYEKRVAQRWASFALLCGSWGRRRFWFRRTGPGNIIACMSRLRRLVVSDRWFFITCRVLPRRRILSDAEFATLAEVIDPRRKEHGFLLSAWVFLPDHWHAIFYPRHPLTISSMTTRAAWSASCLRRAGCASTGCCCLPMNIPGFEASMTVGEEPQRNANYAYLCATCFGSPDGDCYLNRCQGTTSMWRTDPSIGG